MSKVKEYIAQVKRTDKIASNQAAVSRQAQQPQFNSSTLEELYGIDEISANSSKARVELRKTLRELKEKDLLILKLREACHDLTLKYADAENTIDQLRFGTTGSSSGSRRHRAPTSFGGGMTKSRSAFCLAGAGTGSTSTRNASNANHNLTNESQAICSKAKAENVEVREQGTLTSPIPELSPNFKKLHRAAKNKDEINSGSINSSYDVLDESCSNWMEKVQNWKTVDSLFNTSADADSGFRGSEINTATNGDGCLTSTDVHTGGHNSKNSLILHHQPTATISSSGGNSRNSQNFMKYLAHQKFESEFGNNDPNQIRNSVATITRGTNTELQPSTAVATNCEEGRKSQIGQAHENLSLFLRETSGEGEEDVGEDDPRVPNCTQHKYPSGSGRLKSASYQDLAEQAAFLHKSDADYQQRRLSMIGGNYYTASTTYFKTLDPLLDDAARLAKRVQSKSQNLARLLQQSLGQMPQHQQHKDKGN